MNNKRIFSFALLITFAMLLALVAGCNGGATDNGTTPADSPDTIEENGDTSGEMIDLSVYYMHNRGEMGDGSFAKFDIWTETEGVESQGWFSIDVSIGEDSFTITLDGELNGTDLSDEYIEEDEDIYEIYKDRIIFYTLNAMQNTYNHPIGNIMYYYYFTPLDEYFSTITYVGDAEESLFEEGFIHKVPGYDTYAMGEGLTFVREYEGTPVLKLGMSPEYPLNLYVYSAEESFTEYDPDADKFSVELTEFRN